MAIFGLFGSSEPESQGPSASAELFNSTTFRSNVTPSQPESTSSLPQPSSGKPTPTGPAPSASAPTALDAFGGSAFDPAKLHPLAGLSENLDFLQLDEEKLNDLEGSASVLPSRGWTDDLCVGTGTIYLSGLVLGGAWGFKDGFSRPLGNNPPFKLRLNSILNGCTRRGTFVGNSVGVLAIFYNLSNSSLDAIRGKHDAFNAITAAAISGAIFKSTAGIRPALVGAGLMTATAGSWSAIKAILK
ncbi:uncharacterized protein L203_104008 [Cryptococcus depauperatus CBS 7841]|uniref:Uncharacterized protein n=1 Tax=Cryptococcus depauperatus CBS 7841 TaxID=1295531 RepID=A0A1E3IBQ6_9TREE|nr:mitochondrial import inner membrane translocase subunit [Cryptococcus depauperatus CBS 7841]